MKRIILFAAALLACDPGTYAHTGAGGASALGEPCSNTQPCDEAAGDLWCFDHDSLTECDYDGGDCSGVCEDWSSPDGPCEIGRDRCPPAYGGGSYCADLQADAYNCGECGNQCPDGSVGGEQGYAACAAGACCLVTGIPGVTTCT